MWKSLLHYRRVHIAVVLSAAVATAVLTGSLLVGDSVRGSLASLVTERLGRIDQAIVSRLFFREKLAASLNRHNAFRQIYKSSVPAILVQGTALHAENSRRASQVQIQGISPDFLNLYSDTDPALHQLRNLFRSQTGFPPVVINESLSRELHAKVGDSLLLKFEEHSEIPRETILGDQELLESVRTLRLSIAAVVPDAGAGRFGLHPGQLLPMNAFVPLPVLQRALGETGRVNAILVSSTNVHPDGVPLNQLLKEVWELDDAGLKYRDVSETTISLESREIFLNDAIAAQIESATSGFRKQHLLVYIVNSIEARGKNIPYSTVASVEAGAPLRGAADLKEGDILLNRWAAEDLGAQQGDTVRLTYYVLGAGNKLETKQSSFRLAGIVEMEGWGADDTLAPEYPGIQAGDNIRDWDAPFPVDMNRIRDQDEQYWDRYRAAPKAFVSMAQGKSIWGTRYGNLSSIRFEDGRPAVEWKAQLEESLRAGINPEQAGFTFLPVKQRGLEAARGATDFSGLFIGFSLFLIVAACLLTALLFRLGAELRAPEIGVLLAIGYPEKAVVGRLVREGLLLSAIGTVIGLFAATAYTALLLEALRRWWGAALGAPFLELHVSPLSLFAGGAISLALVFFSIRRSVRRLAQLPIPGLLGGSINVSRSGPARAWIRIAAWLLPAIAIVTSAVTAGAPANLVPLLFFASGVFLLIGGLCAFNLWLHGKHAPVRSGIREMAVRNSMWRPARSLLGAALISSACFVIVAVGANRKSAEPSLSKNSGSGGFTLLAHTDIPFVRPLELNAEDDPALSSLAPATRAYSLRYLPGEDASCLNLYRPEKPHVLGAPGELIARGGFAFTEAVDKTENPWTLLDKQMPPGVIPAIGDANSVRWILHSGLGKDIQMTGSDGKPVNLRIVALLSDSVFQSELLISEKNFQSHFPDRYGYSFFLLETPVEARDKTADALESAFSDFGFDSVDAADRLARFHEVENTYIAIFQALGGLGVMLGTIGLAVVLLRNVAERRKELAALQAFGFQRKRVAAMIWLENTFVLVVGIVIGTVAGLIAALPHLAGNLSNVPWLSLVSTLFLIFEIGTIAGTAGAYIALRAPLLPALKGEA